MKLKRHDDYRPVEFPWIKQVPSHWVNKRLKHLLSSEQVGIKIGPFGSALKNELLSEDGAHKVYGQENVISRDFQAGGRRVDADMFQGLKDYEILPGDILVTMMGSSGRCCKVPEGIEKGIMDSHLLRIRLDDKQQNQLIERLVDQAPYVRTQIELMGKGAIMHGINSQIVKNLIFHLPPVNEQREIRIFLDLETTKIDALIAEQQRLIGLLQEKRQAVISHAVTKGLNPNAPMKDSGVEWLGEVPEHWTTGKLCYYATLDTGSTPDRQRPEYWNGDIPWVKTGEVRYEDICETEEKITELALRETSCSLQQPGTLLMALYGQGVTRGRVGMLMTAASCNQACAAITPSPRIDGRYLELYLTNAYAHLRSLGNETTQQNLNLDFAGKLELLVPPLAEQKCIWQTTKQRTSELDALLLQAADAIVLLQERRSALISAAVTGQIDVRGLAQEVAA